MTDLHKPLRLVVPIDRAAATPEALVYACAIARPGDEILVLTAVQLSDINPVVLPRSVSVAEMRRTVREDAERDLYELVAEVLPPAGVAMRTLVEDGSPTDVIVRHAPSADSSLVIMSSHGRGAIGRLTYGSVADRVARTSSAPVLLIRLSPDHDPVQIDPIRRLVVPLDGSSRSERALPNAIGLARRLEVPILLVAVSEIERMAMIYGAALPAEAYAELASEAESDLRAELQGVVDRVAAAGIEVELRVLSGAVVAAIESVVETGDIIVMTSHGRGGVRRWIIGSVSERLGRTASVPVMLVPSM